jgi:hypothetical protein
MTLPFTFAWVDSTETTFDPATMDRFDEDVFSLEMKHDEGQIPTLDIVIENPRIGLLSPGRKLWAWIGWRDDDGVLQPFFFGVLIGVPTDMFKEKVKLQFIARSHSFIEDKQAVAETMKVAPYYDPIWFDTQHRDDPDSILEGWSALWHVDRKSLEISASDILLGEDGTVTFDEDTAFYDSVSLQLGQPPLVNVRVEATVNWTQRTSGFFAVPTVNMTSYTGETFLSGWPSPGSGLGGGYTVESSFATDIYRVGQTPDTSYSYQWSNTDPDKGNCSNESASSSSSGPALLSPNPLVCVLTAHFVTGVCDPFSDPPVNVPATTSVTGMIIPQWSVSGDMTVRYDANRQYSEVIVFDMLANVQGVLASPTVSQDTELITIASVDIGKPLQNVLAWSDFKNSAVPIAQVIFPNNPTTPGGTSYQICINPGTAGSVEPTFSDFPGLTTTDNTVLWASLGESPLTDAPAWNPAAPVPVGQIISIQDQVFNEALGKFETVPGATSYYLCRKEGTTNAVYRQFQYVPPVFTNNGTIPAPVIIDVIDPPTFSTSVGTTIHDGTVEWYVLGPNPTSLGIPIGGTPSDVRANNFFPTVRGKRALEFLISKARARLRFRSRAVKIGFSAPFSTGINLSCRMNATLFDPRLPGGAATGKIISYTLSASGNGKLVTHVEIGCSVGFGDSIAEITGTPEYASPGYMQTGYQIYDGQMVAHGSNDTTYSPPRYVGFDDGLKYPLTWDQISDGGIVSGSLDAQRDAIQKSFTALHELQYLQRWDAQNSIVPPGGLTTTQTQLPPDLAWKIEREQQILAAQSTPYVMEANGLSWSALLKPCAGNGPFEGAYFIIVSPLVVPQGINLEAPSSP